MTDRDKPELRRMLTRIASVFGREIDADLIDAYYMALRPLSIDAIRRAVQKATMECSYFPKPVELRSLATSTERPHYREVDGQPVYECLRCMDTGVEITHRKRGDGASIGMFSKPCLCMRGAATERAWQQPNTVGDIFADTARENAMKLRDAGAYTEEIV